MDESSLIAASLRGQVSAFNQLVEHYQDLAYSVAYRMLGDREEASDVTQDAFISAYNALAQYRGGSFRAWLLRIVTNGCYDHLRSRQRRRQESLDDLLAEHDDLGLAAAPAETPENVALSREMLSFIAKSLHQLPPDQRAAVVLSDVQGLSYEEIAEVMDCSLGTVKSRLSRGRARLRDILLAERELLPSRFRLQHGGEST